LGTIEGKIGQYSRTDGGSFLVAAEVFFFQSPGAYVSISLREIGRLGNPISMVIPGAWIVLRRIAVIGGMNA
jgi:hypothetical protein